MSFTKIDPHFGTDEDMIELVSDAHNHGIRVMMDGVFNHTGIFFKPWQDILQNGPESKYYDWFMINSWPLRILEDPLIRSQATTILSASMMVCLS